MGAQREWIVIEEKKKIERSHVSITWREAFLCFNELRRPISRFEPHVENKTKIKNSRNINLLSEIFLTKS